MNHQELINTIKNAQERHFLVVYDDGRKSKERLFVNGETVARYKTRSRTYGYPIDTSHIVSVEPCQTTGVEFFRKNVRKMFNCLTESGLWGKLLPELAVVYHMPTEEVKELLGDWKKTTEKLERMEMKEMSATLFHSLANKGAIKAIDFGGEGEWCRKVFEEAIRENRQFRVRYRSKYDISLSVEPQEGQKRAWYSEEYKNCGNGYYYLAIDHQHAVFIEKD